MCMACRRSYFHPPLGRSLRVCNGTDAEHGMRLAAGAFMEKGQQMRGSQTPVQKYWHHLLELVQAGELDPSVVVSHRPPLEEAAHAYKIFNEKQVRGGVASLSRSCPGLAHADLHMKLSGRLYEACSSTCFRGSQCEDIVAQNSVAEYSLESWIGGSQQA